MVVAVQSKVSTVDVLISGAGPAGLMAANALAKAGVSVRIVDKKFEKVETGQADGIQPRTIEVFQSYGLAHRLLEEGNQIYYSAFYDPTPEGGIARSGRACRVLKNKSEVDLSGSRYPYSITLHQGAIESIFVDSMAEEGVNVERPVQPAALSLSEDESELEDPDSYPVKVVLHKLDASGEAETEIVRAKYMLGSDGAHSWVRKELGFTMDGEQTNYVWGVVDTVPVTDFPDIRNRCVIHSLHGSMMVIPREGDVVRFYTQLSDEDAQEVLNVKGRVDMTKWSPEKLLEIGKRQLYPYEVTFPEDKLSWWTLYIIGQRVASAYSKNDRIFIAGDACHTHSPKAGQGMNASMNDTHNLAWKLAYVLRGWANRSLLQTYEFERRKYAQDLIDFDRKWSKLFSGKPRTEQNKDGVSHEEMMKAYETFNGFTSGTGIKYAPSPITDTRFQHVAGNLPIGIRMPSQVIVRVADARPFDLQDLLPSDTRFKVVIFTGDLNIESQKAKFEEFVSQATEKSGFLTQYGCRSEMSAGWSEVFEVLSVLIGKKETTEYTDVPSALRPHWSKVFVDDVAVSGTEGGKAYSSYGISPEGAVIIVRPDGYIGTVVPLDGAAALNEYFAGFMKPGLLA
ncbi:hypothetical protein ACEPAH_3787 [Sanghuangporus vaninii]